MPKSRNLKYVQAAHVRGDGVCLSGLHIEAGADRKLGELDGVIVEPSTRRLCYFVVDGGEGRYLMPLDTICFDPRHCTLRVMAEPDPDSWRAFDPDDYAEFGEDDLLASMFARSAA